MDDPKREAVSRFEEGFNCAQAVFATFAARRGMDESQALRLASPFGGGVSRQGEVCGAVSGGLMAIGLALGSDTPAGKDRTYQISQSFLQNFISRHGTLLCRELIGSDIRTPEGRQQANQSGVFKNLCPLLVGEAAGIVQSMLVKAEAKGDEDLPLT